ncbi:MAG TPA: thiamine-phosphate kinase [Candidatus Sumerlaeota bacterium]|nr:MAG: Thiamine-monophosphate kinase [candidate division BRC1 bacterium ADurb.Bin183]HOE64510.1 thiamine-phosphate kinase [Candidatus Sumerlaeota bacterium]HRR30063.1 thiamine-phosphate kinase [Candidatus Sumerlaeia bacterium]HON51261.1 thiamine-phosphate kinase [Candidatus Sumerlaeota bacterium]HOR64422.1 thiamine-phosphate kinase [Candidatus Sumerlaeota bacterium]
MKLFETGELGFLDSIKRFAKNNALVKFGFGDDAAILHDKSGKNHLAITTDLLVEDTHFSFKFCTPRELGVKAYEVNASDLAAMGAIPYAAFLSIGVRGDMDMQDMIAFYKGFESAARRHDCVIAGGDTVRAERLIVSVMLIGLRPQNAPPMLRSSASPGEHVYITGAPGESGMGLHLLINGQNNSSDKRLQPLIKKHLLPKARIREGIALADARAVGAAIDISDGVYNELRHISRMSKVRLVIETAKLPVSAGLKRECRRLGIDPLEMLLFGGEDYELLFTSPHPLSLIKKIFQDAGSKTHVQKIGGVEKGRGVIFVDADGKRTSFADKTFRHFVFNGE